MILSMFTDRLTTVRCLEKFLNGEDSNIDYVSIDNNESLDDFKIRENDEEEKYFDEDDSNSSNGKNADEKSS